MNSHICHVISHLGSGGAEQYVVQLSNYLFSNGHRVTIIAGEPQTLRDRVDPGVQIEILRLHPGKTRSLFVYMRVLVSSIKHLVTYFRRERITVVHTHLAASALPAWIAAKVCGIPIIHSKMHTEAIASRYERTLFASRIQLLLVDRFLAFTSYSEDEIRRYWHAPFRHIIASSIGVDTKHFASHETAKIDHRRAFGITKETKVALVLARLQPEKDVELAIKGVLALDDPNILMLVAGDGPQREYLERIVHEVPSRTCIRFLGFLQDPRPVYAAADLLLQTTRGPDLGTVVLEAMASGVPVLIAYRNEDERKMAENTFGGLDIGEIAEATPGAIATAIRRILENSVRLNTLRDEVRKFVERNHDRDTAYANMIEHYAAIEKKHDGTFQP